MTTTTNDVRVTKDTIEPNPIHLDEKGVKALASDLDEHLASLFVLFHQYQKHHWLVEGPQFRDIHIFLEESYNEVHDQVDEIAERIRSLGLPAPGTYRQFSELSAITEDDSIPAAQDMIRNLVEGHETTARTARKVFAIAEGASDEPTCDLLTQRMQVHEKTAWMLRSLLE